MHRYKVPLFLINLVGVISIIAITGGGIHPFQELAPSYVFANAAASQPPVKSSPAPPVVPSLVQPAPQQPPDPAMVGPPPIPAQDTFYDPNSSVTFALGDLTQIEQSHRSHIRWLSLYNAPKKDRQPMGQTVSFVVNSLSRRKQVYIPVFVGASDETLIRINLDDYGILPSAWDELAQKGSGVRPYPEPYFHSFLEKQEVVYLEKKSIKEEQVPTGKKLTNGQPEMKVERKEVVERLPTSETRRGFIFSQAPWLDANGIATLIKECNTTSPIIRADWFIANAILPPAYFNLLGLGKNIKDFETLVFSNDEVSQKARSQDKGIQVKSIVARNNRTLTRSPTLGSSYGYYWKSRDSLTSVGNRDYVKNPLDETFDATEDIATLPNGLQVYFVTNGKGDRLDFADTNIAIDNTAVDRVVRVGRSCMICHSDGIRHIDDEIRAITQRFKFKESVKLITPDETKYYRIQDLFSSDLAKQIVRDQQNYADAIGLTTGLEPQRNASQLSAFYNGYAEETLSKETIARECGVQLADLERYIRGIDVGGGKRIGSNDNVILGLVKNRIVRRDNFEQSYQGFMLTIQAIREHEKKSK